MVFPYYRHCVICHTSILLSPWMLQGGDAWQCSTGSGFSVSGRLIGNPNISISRNLYPYLWPSRCGAISGLMRFRLFIVITWPWSRFCTSFLLGIPICSPYCVKWCNMPCDMMSSFIPSTARAVLMCRWFLILFSGIPNFPQQTWSQPSSQDVEQRNAVPSALLTSLVAASLSPSTKTLYKHPLIDFAHSCQSVRTNRFLEAPTSTAQVLQYVTVLYQQGLSCATICCHLSAISFWHKIHDWHNPVNSFAVRKGLIGISKCLPPYDPHKLPVTPALLRRISLALPEVFSDPFQVILYWTAFFLAFFAFLWVSEYASSRHSIQLADISVFPSVILICFRSFKFSSQHITNILLPFISSDLCPVKALTLYLAIRPWGGGSLFIDHMAQPMSYNDIRATLRHISVYIDLPPGVLTSHSFHICAVTTVAAIGIPDEDIMKMGRWSSAAFHKYIQCQVNSFWPFHFFPITLQDVFSGA